MQPIAPNAIELDILERIPLFRTTQPVFEKELNETIEDQTVELGLQREQQFEGRERHVQQAVFGKGLIPTKGCKQDQDYHVPGYIPASGYHVFNCAELQANILYDFTELDWAFLAAQEQEGARVDEEQFEHLMTVFDLMFPLKYKNVQVSVEGHAFQQIKDAVMTVLRSPEQYGLGWEPTDRVSSEVLAKVYLHFCRQRDKNKQPLMQHMNTETTHKDKREFFNLADKKPQRNLAKNRSYTSIALLYNMVSEYVVVRELLNCYHTGLKYIDGLQMIDQEASPYEIDPQESFEKTVARFLEEKRPAIPNVVINPIYNVMFPFKPYLQLEQLRQQLQRTQEKHKDLFVPIENTRGIVDKVKRETNEFLEFYNEVMDGVEE